MSPPPHSSDKCRPTIPEDEEAASLHHAQRRNARRRSGGNVLEEPLGPSKGNTRMQEGKSCGSPTGSGQAYIDVYCFSIWTMAALMVIHNIYMSPCKIMINIYLYNVFFFHSNWPEQNGNWSATQHRCNARTGPRFNALPHRTAAGVLRHRKQIRRKATHTTYHWQCHCPSPHLVQSVYSLRASDLQK